MRKNSSLDVTDPLDSQIATLCGRVEALVPGCRAGVCIASADHTKLERSVFPNLPPTFQQAIKELPMGPPYIGCCTAAMQGRQIITVHDLEKESKRPLHRDVPFARHKIVALAPRLWSSGCGYRHFRHGLW